jgi:hypothetical protein
LLTDPDHADLDTFLDVELHKGRCRIVSYAEEGLPYSESLYNFPDPEPPQIVTDLIAGRLTPEVLELFNGLDMGEVSGLACFISDRRNTPAIDTRVTLTRSESGDPPFTVRMRRSQSDSSCCQSPAQTDRRITTPTA